MVGVAQSVEPRIVDPVVVGSSPIVHPSTILTIKVLSDTKNIAHSGPLAQLAEQGTLNPKVIGSIPIRPIILALHSSSLILRDCGHKLILAVT